MQNLTRNAACYSAAASILLLLLLGATDVRSQDARLNMAVGGLPGVGLVAVHSSPTLFVFTREVAVYGDYTVGGSDRLLVAVGVGGSVQLTRILEIVRNSNIGAARLDVGMRLGPSFYYAFVEQSAEEEARSFRVMFDPFVRGAYRAGGGRVLFAEIGAQAPNLRAGVSFGL